MLNEEFFPPAGQPYGCLQSEYRSPAELNRRSLATDVEGADK